MIDVFFYVSFFFWPFFLNSLCSFFFSIFFYILISCKASNQLAMVMKLFFLFFSLYTFLWFLVNIDGYRCSINFSAFQEHLFSWEMSTEHIILSFFWSFCNSQRKSIYNENTILLLIFSSFAFFQRLKLQIDFFISVWTCMNFSRFQLVCMDWFFVCSCAHFISSCYRFARSIKNAFILLMSEKNISINNAQLYLIDNNWQITTKNCTLVNARNEQQSYQYDFYYSTAQQSH